MSAAVLTSPALAGAVVNSHGRIVPVAAVPMMSPMPGCTFGVFTRELFPDGRVQLRDARGEGCGVFANEQLAAVTAGFLSR